MTDEESMDNLVLALNFICKEILHFPSTYRSLVKLSHGLTKHQGEHFLDKRDLAEHQQCLPQTTVASKVDQIEWITVFEKGGMNSGKQLFSIQIL